jgi:hypothetical protein
MQRTLSVLNALSTGGASTVTLLSTSRASVTDPGPRESSFGTEMRSGLWIMTFEISFLQRLSTCKSYLFSLIPDSISSTDHSTMAVPKSMNGRGGERGSAGR